MQDTPQGYLKAGFQGDAAELRCHMMFGDTIRRDTDDEPILLGAFGPLSGKTPLLGHFLEQGILMAVDEINSRGGIHGRPLEIVLRDDSGEPDEAASVVREMIVEERVAAVVGGVASRTCHAAAKVCQEQRVPMVAAFAPHPAVTEAGPYIFRACISDAWQGTAAANFALQALGARRAALLVDTSLDYSVLLAFNFTEEFERRGGLIVSVEEYEQIKDGPSSEQGLRAILEEAIDGKPDIIYVPGYYPDVGRIARLVRSMDQWMPLMGGDGWHSPHLTDFAANALEDCYLTEHWSADDPSFEVQNFIRRYQGMFDGEFPAATAALAYDAIGVAADALIRGGPADDDFHGDPAFRRRLRNSLANTTDYPGVSGAISFDANRNAVRSVVVMQVRGDGFRYDATVHPDGSLMRVPE